MKRSKDIEIIYLYKFCYLTLSFCRQRWDSDYLVASVLQILKEKSKYQVFNLSRVQIQYTRKYLFIVDDIKGSNLSYFNLLFPDGTFDTHHPDDCLSLSNSDFLKKKK